MFPLSEDVETIINSVESLESTSIETFASYKGKEGDKSEAIFRRDMKALIMRRKQPTLRKMIAKNAKAFNCPFSMIKPSIAVLIADNNDNARQIVERTKNLIGIIKARSRKEISELQEYLNEPKDLISKKNIVVEMVFLSKTRHKFQRNVTKDKIVFLSLNEIEDFIKGIDFEHNFIMVISYVPFNLENYTHINKRALQVYVPDLVVKEDNRVYVEQKYLLPFEENFYKHYETIHLISICCSVLSFLIFVFKVVIFMNFCINSFALSLYFLTFSLTMKKMNYFNYKNFLSKDFKDLHYKYSRMEI